MSDDETLGPAELLKTMAEQVERTEARAEEQTAEQTAQGERSFACPRCSFVGKSARGLALHARVHTLPSTDFAPSRDGPKTSLGEAEAWIKRNVNPQLLQGAAFLGVPRQILAQGYLDMTPAGPVEVWPGELTPIGQQIVFDDMAVRVYAAAYVYGQDTWLAEYLEKWGKKLLPVGLCVAVAAVTVMHVQKVMAVKAMLEARVKEMQAAAEAQAKAQAAAATAAA